MLTPAYTKPFRKQYKLMKKHGKDIEKLIEVMDLIINEKTLPPKYCNHPLHGKWEGAYDCQVQGDWVLIYEPEKKIGKVTFHRTGSHSDLGI